MDERSLIEILVDLKLISLEKLREIEKLHQNMPEKSFETLLIESTAITELDLIKAKEILYQVPWIDLSKVEIDPELVLMIPEKLARRHLLLPLESREDGFHIAIANPHNILALDEVHIITGKTVIPHLAIPSQIIESIEHFYRLDRHSAHQMIQQLEEEVMVSGEEEILEWEEVDQAPIIRLVNHIIYQALQNRASDIHIEPTRDETRVRYRIDGVLSTLHTFPRKVHPPLISRLKIMASLDISQHFNPQDGSISYIYGQRKINLRISIIPTIYGEKAVLRILNRDSQILSLEELGFLKEDLQIYKELLKKKYGIILVTGPTGSGKSTTLSSSVKFLASPAINISTVEDPVEYKIDLVNQIQVNEKTGLTFAKALRSLLRQDPDVLMIGEIRDEETANIAIRAALTGHLVLSSLHTNDAVSTITRLSNMGIPAYLIASTLIGAVAQRLVRRICPDCREEVKISEEEKRFFQAKVKAVPDRAFIGKGCSKCNYTGYYGRVGVFEILIIDEKIREKITNQISYDWLYNYYLANGKTLLQDGLIKVREGLTTVNEILRVIL
ncbi:hypothetical protein BBF96_09340 [Anoxybacter fermentans]|uniref:Bacterial type II secretion system protein E domain-containing protein n=1 Tax=Anoxybacter fermentans TaxID=1323375 RepID=A0A3Q9HQV7_9FIRM|nr:GspE/PulE family protein [Anoxybacter fermentans]AZR73575.1 hypothetical protein BBF96_09340 [Anoxybacter fermentans]